MSRAHGTEDPAAQAWSIDLPDAGSTRGTSINEARWSEDGSRLFVSRTVDPRAWPLLDAARPDIGALMVVAGVLAIVIGAVRMFRHPRTAGRSYCRRCNHDLNAVHGERPSAPRCPECGLPLGGVRNSGGSPVSRAIPPFVSNPAHPCLDTGIPVLVFQVLAGRRSMFLTAWTAAEHPYQRATAA